MKSFFTPSKRLSVAFALASFAVVGVSPAFAQSVTGNGSVLPWHYGADGARIMGWTVEAPSVPPVGHAVLKIDSGKRAFAKAPASIPRLAAQFRSGSVRKG
jgi:hypothetical protein